MITRRAALRATGVFLTGFAADQAFEGVLSAVLAPEPVSPFIATDMPWRLFDRYAATSQAGALSAWRDGRPVADQIGEISKDQRFAVIDFHGDEARYARIGAGLSVITTDMLDAAVVDVPEPEYGGFVYARAARATISGQPLFQSCIGRIDGRRIRYTSLMLPCDAGRVVSVGRNIEFLPSARTPGSGSARPGGDVYPAGNA